MSLEFYQVLHVTGLVLLMLGLGGTLLAPPDTKTRTAKMLHGAGALVMLIAGFGLMAKRGMGAPHLWPAWLILKMVIWLAIAVALPLLVSAKKVPRPAGWVIVAALAFAAAWLAFMKPLFR
jgi:hypothetical protein